MSRPRWLMWSVQLVLILAILAFGTDFLLFANRVRFGLQERNSRQVRWQPDDYLRGRFVPGQKNAVVGRSRVSINQLGFRGGEPRRTAHRVVCLGDSVTFGWGSSDDETAYPAVLAKRLAADTAQDVDVVNSGMPRWNSCDLLDLYVTRIIPLRPQVVVFLAGWDDIGYEFAPPAEETGNTPLRIVRAAALDSYSTLHILDTLAQRLRVPRNPETVLRAREKARDAIRWERFDEHERIVTATVELIRQNGSQPVLVTLPHFLKPVMTRDEKRILLPHLLAWPDVSYAGWRHMVAGVNARIRHVASVQAVPLADCESSVPAGHFVDLCHLDDTGYAELAACIAPTVESALRATALKK